MLIASPLLAQDLIIPTISTKESTQYFSGSGCMSFTSDDKLSVKCDHAAITGADNPNTHLNFQFIDRDGNGTIFITERESTADKGSGRSVFSVIGFAFRNGGEISKVSYGLDPSTSLCFLGSGKTKIACQAKLATEDLSITSALSR
jgi:hypothetical protein